MEFCVGSQQKNTNLYEYWKMWMRNLREITLNFQTECIDKMDNWSQMDLEFFALNTNSNSSARFLTEVVHGKPANALLGN